MTFSLGLTGMTAGTDLPATIQQGPVVVAYGSPDSSLSTAAEAAWAAPQAIPDN